MNHINVTSSMHESDREQFDILKTDQLDLMPEWAYALTTTVLFAIGIFGSSLNLIVIIIMCKDMEIWTPLNIILLNLVCSDFSVSIFGNPFTLAASINHGWFFGERICTAYGFFMSLLGITSITTLTVLSYERYTLIACPFSSSHLTKKGAKIIVLFIWLYSFCLTSPPLFGWGNYELEAANISCSVNWESQTFNATSYIIFLFVFGLVVPLIVIIYSYARIVITMKDGNQIKSGQVNKAESRVTCMIFVMIIAFMIAWMPYAVFALIEQFGDSELITPSKAVIPALLAKSSICYNPMIYVGMNSQFRAAWRRVFHGRDQHMTMTINDTSINYLSDSSTQPYIECAITKIDKKKKKRKFKARTFFNCNRNIVKSNKATSSKVEQGEIVRESEKKRPKSNENISLEMKMFQMRTYSSDVNISGKDLKQIVRANSNSSNYC